jgi:hypothetical protein
MATIQITGNKTLESIAAEFNQHFPNLGLNFFESSHGVGEESDQWDTLNLKLPLEQVGRYDHNEELSINGHLKVATFEQRFQELFGIGVQVMTKVSGRWEQTIESDNLSLSEQDRQSVNH